VFDGPDVRDDMMMTMMSTVELGDCTWLSHGATGTDPTRLRFLPTLGLLVLPEARRGEHWWCRVVGARRGPMGECFVRVTPEDLARGESAITVDADEDPDGFVLGWLASVWQRWPNGPAVILAQRLVELAREPVTVRLVLGRELRLRVLSSMGLRRFRARALLDRLVLSGFLVAFDAVADTERYALTLPAVAGRLDSGR
jgi:hypothetical protein